MKTLIIKYLPGRDYSNTKKLYDHVREELKDHEIEELDLLEEFPDFFTHEKLMSYYARNYQGKTLNPEQKELMKKMDRFTDQVKSADVVILAYPMHNFGMPGIIKTWFDNIMQAGIAFEYGPSGPVGLFKNKKALVVYTSSGEYSTEKVSTQYPEWNTLTFLSKIEFMFMGFEEIEIISASTGNAQALEDKLDNAKKEITALLGRWY